MPAIRSVMPLFFPPFLRGSLAYPSFLQGSLLKFPLHQQGVKNEGTIVPWGGQDPGQGGKKDGTIVLSNGIRARRKNRRE
jgi:hypothetical protein